LLRGELQCNLTLAAGTPFGFEKAGEGEFSESVYYSKLELLYQKRLK